MADEQNNAKTQIITNRGLELLGKSPLTGANQTYWLGYFGFAYVPDEIKEQYPEEVPSAASTTLTEHGDVIYNIWQGSMTPNGYKTDIGTSNAAELMTQCQYTNNIMSNFRYSLDKGRNTLSLYKRNADGTVTQWGETFQGAGVDANDVAQDSALPIPAALYYSANSAGDGHVVTGDPRTYAANGTLWGDSSDDWNKEPTDVLAPNDKKNVSNFNKYHAPAISDGYLQGQEPSCRNMATVTKYFPVAHYTVTSAEGSKVSALKLTLTIDLNNIAAKVANRTNFATMGADEKPLNPVGFKFNRIGIYAASMAVHHYTYDEETNQCEPVKDVQYQVIGDDEPVLFAIIDLDQAITIEEGSALGDWTTNIIINFGNSESADSQIPRDTVVYYNLYEDDSIVWYKNQLIANASTSEAVTNLGIELNYLKNQIENMRSGSSCVMVDDTPYALLNHTHNYMKNIVDTGEANNGAVRGIYTKPENTTVEGIAGTYSCGNDSMTLGKDSATATAYSVNVSNRGILGDYADNSTPCDSTLLMGGVDDEDLVVKAKNSLVNMATGGELTTINASLLLSDIELHAPFDYRVSGSIVTRPVAGLALSDDTDDYKYENIRYMWPARLNSATSDSIIWNSVLMGNNRYMGTMANVLALGNDSGFRQSLTRIGEYDPLGDLDVADGSLPYVRGEVINILLAGRNSKLHAGASQVIAVGDELNIPEGSTNVIVIGKYVNMDEKNWPRNPGTAQREYDDIISIDEFVERHDDADFKAAHTRVGSLAIVGEGTIPSSCDIHDAEGQSVVADVRGVSLYIRYDNGRQQWIESKTTRKMLDLCNATSRWKNILMLGEGSGLFNYAPGDKSKNSIFIGDDSAWSHTTFSNSFINLLGTSSKELRAHDQSAPKSYFDNVWFVGHLPNNNKTGSNGLINNLSMEWSNTGVDGAVTPHVLSDIFVFNGKNENVFNLTKWYGISSDLNTVSGLLYNVLRDTDHPTPYDVCMQHKSPTIYTGGIALGGSGSNNCTYGLMMLGHNFTNWYGYSSFATGLKNIVHIEKLSTSGNYFLDYPDSNNHAVVRYVGDGEDSNRFALFRLSHDGSVHAGRPEDISDQSYDTGDEKFCMLSPHTGKVLMVQDHQELDGTLHVGLGAYSDWNYPGQVVIASQYIAGSNKIGFSVVMTRNGEPYKYQDVSDTDCKVGRHYDHFYLSKDEITNGTHTYYHKGKFGVHFAVDITKSVAADDSVSYMVETANIYIEPMPGTMYFFAKCDSTDQYMGFSPTFTQSTYVNGLAGFDELNIGLCYSSAWRTNQNPDNIMFYYPSLKLSIGSGDMNYLVDNTGFEEVDHVCEYVSATAGDWIYKLSPLRVNDKINSTYYRGNYESSVRYFETYVYNDAVEEKIQAMRGQGYYRFPYALNKLSVDETTGVRYT